MTILVRLRERALSFPASVYLASGASILLGLFFLFVWAPHPWGWEGFDHYHQLALTVASGRPFPTMEVPWGYAYFLAAFYRAFGDRPWIPLLAQVALNATIPILTYHLAKEWIGERTAATAALAAGIFSFNTVYASTQSSDAVCTVLFMAAVVAFVAARRRDRWHWFAGVGALGGLASQFRPNLILVPGVLAAYAIAERPTRRRAAQAATMIAAAAAMLAPWAIRNYRLTGIVLPTSVHGGVQLWYGTLQVGPYLRSRAYNPRSVFEGAAFEYTSLANVPIVVRADIRPCLDGRPTSASFIYWTDRDPARRRIRSALNGPIAADLPASRQPAVLYYYFESFCREDTPPRPRLLPAAGDRGPFVFFVSRDHLGDLDVHGDLLDVFDLVRIVRHTAWGEPLPFGDRLRAAGVADIAPAVAALTPVPAGGFTSAPPPTLSIEEHRATLRLADGSTLTVPRRWRGRITDLAFDRGLAVGLMHSSASIGELLIARERGTPPSGYARGERDDIAIDRVFYRAEPHMMQRYAALALDNIRREPLRFAAACLYRAGRLFVVAGSDDPHTTQQFARSERVYNAATAGSIVALGLFVGGAIVAWRRGHEVALPLVLIAYIPATLAPVLTNMRYSITVQPLMFVFVAVALRAIRKSEVRSLQSEKPEG